MSNIYSKNIYSKNKARRKLNATEHWEFRTWFINKQVIKTILLGMNFNSFTL